MSNVKEQADRMVAAVKDYVARATAPLQERLTALETRARPVAMREGQIAAAVSDIYNEAGRRLIPTVCITADGEVVVKMVEAPPEAPRPWPTETTITARDDDGRAKTMLTRPVDDAS